MVRSDRAHVPSDADTYPVGNPLTISHMPRADLNPAINDTSVDVIPSNRSAPTSLEISSGVDEFDRESAFVGHEMELAKNSHSVSVFLLVNTMIGSGRSYKEEDMTPLGEAFKRAWGLLLLDEVHMAPARSYQRFISRVDARCVVGLTATLLREDEGIDAIPRLIGPVLFEAHAKDLERFF